MRTLLSPARVLCISALVLLFAVPVFGSTSLYEGDTNDWNHDATDYHIHITSEGPITGISGVLSDDGEFHEPFINGEGTNEVFIMWLIDAPPGDSIGFCIEFEAGDGYKIDKSFTAVKGTVEIQQPVLGERQTKDGHSLTNAFHLPIRFSNVQYSVQREPLAETDAEAAELMEDIAAGMPFVFGWDKLPAGEVGAREEALVLDGVDIEDGESLFIYYEGQFVGRSFGKGYTVIRQGKR